MSTYPTLRKKQSQLVGQRCLTPHLVQISRSLFWKKVALWYILTVLTSGTEACGNSTQYVNEWSEHDVGFHILTQCCRSLPLQEAWLWFGDAFKITPIGVITKKTPKPNPIFQSIIDGETHKAQWNSRLHIHLNVQQQVCILPTTEPSLSSFPSCARPDAEVVGSLVKTHVLIGTCIIPVSHVQKTQSNYSNKVGTFPFPTYFFN